MKKELYEYINKINEENKINEKEFFNNLLIFQHERLIHLLVTIFVGICLVLVFLFFLLLENIYLFIILILLLCLFIPYIIHYYNLENGIFKLYKLYWKEKDV